MLNRLTDVLRKTTYTAPINGVVTYIAVRVGENVVPGIQNATGSYLMTISDMSVVTSEVMVDEADIVSVKLGQEAEVTMNALPGKFFMGKVTEVGTQAVLRSSGLASTQSTTGQSRSKRFQGCGDAAKIRLTDVRPGTLFNSQDHLAPSQKRTHNPHASACCAHAKDLDEAAKESGRNSITLAAARPTSDSSSSTSSTTSATTSSLTKNPDVQGIFVLRNRRAEFISVVTGIVGVTDIEVLGGVQEGDTIVTGSYKTLRTLKPDDAR